MSKLELGERRLDAAEFMRFSRAIGADPFALFKVVDTPESKLNWVK